MGNIPLIEDCSHSFYTKIGNKYTGSLGDAAIFSFGKARMGL